MLELPYQGKGATYELATSLAKEMQCYLVAGFPEQASAQALSECDVENGMFDARTPFPDSDSLYRPRVARKAFNSAMLVDPNGQLVNIFRKHFLYEADTSWADEGPGFSYVQLPNLGRVCVAVCMDLNRTPRYLRSLHARFRL